MSAISRIAAIIRKAAPKTPSTDHRNLDAGSGVEIGRVVTVYSLGADVEYQGTVVSASQATDEPLTAGNLVYVARTESGGVVVLGTVK